MKKEKIYLSNFHSHAHTIYKDLVNATTIWNQVEYIPIKKIKYLSYIKRRILNFFSGKVKYYDTENVNSGSIFNLWTINYSKSKCYFFLEHFVILSTDFTNFRKHSFIKEVKNILEWNNCKKIVCLSAEAKNRIDNFFQSDIIKEKTTYIYPSIWNINPHHHMPILKKSLNILFISNWDFYAKWGREIMLCYKRFFKDNSNYHFTIKCKNIPEEYKFDWTNITYIEENLDYNDVLDLYKKSHVFLQPLYKSGFWVFLEAMSFWLPVITSKVFDIPEIIQNNVNGFNIDFCHSLFDNNEFYNHFSSTLEYDNFILKTNVSDTAIEEMSQKIILLKEDTELYKKISKNNIEETSKWRFSNIYRDTKILELLQK